MSHFLLKYFPQYIKSDILNLIMLPYIMYIRLTVIIICAVKEQIVVLKKPGFSWLSPTTQLVTAEKSSEQ